MASNDDIHAERREPEQPQGTLDLAEAGEKLLSTARGLAAGRAARNLTPHVGADLTQTLLALCEGRRLGTHASPGPSTVHVLRGAVTIHADDEELPVEQGQWAALPRSDHDLAARDDAVVVLTVHAVGQE